MAASRNPARCGRGPMNLLPREKQEFLKYMGTSWKENESLNDYSFPQGQRWLAWYVTRSAPTGLDGCWPLPLSECLTQDKLTTGNGNFGIYLPRA